MSITFTKEEFESAFNKIYNDLICDKTKQDKPRVVFLCGQPGAGKSRCGQLYANQFKDDVVKSDVDEYRRFHPHFNEIVAKNPNNWSVYTHEFASKMGYAIVEKLASEKYNVIVDGTLRNLQKSKELLAMFKNNGYENLEIAVTATKPDISKTQIILRYVNALEKKTPARLVPFEVHNDAIVSIPKNLNVIESDNDVDSIKIYDRDCLLLYDSLQNKSQDFLSGDMLEQIYSTQLNKYEQAWLKQTIDEIYPKLDPEDNETLELLTELKKINGESLYEKYRELEADYVYGSITEEEYNQEKTILAEMKVIKSNQQVGQAELAENKLNNLPLLVNYFAGPSAGKTTSALELTAELKKQGYNVEYVSEFAKELVLENRLEELKNQEFVTDGQYHRLDRIRNSADIIVTDSPVLLGKVYGEKRISEEYSKQIEAYHNSFETLNLFIARGTTFQTEGRVHNLEQSKALDNKIITMLQENNVKFDYVQQNDIANTVDKINKLFKNLEQVKKNGGYEMETQKSKNYIFINRISNSKNEENNGKIAMSVKIGDDIKFSRKSDEKDEIKASKELLEAYDKYLKDNNFQDIQEFVVLSKLEALQDYKTKADIVNEFKFCKEMPLNNQETARKQNNYCCVNVLDGEFSKQNAGKVSLTMRMGKKSIFNAKSDKTDKIEATKELLDQFNEYSKKGGFDNSDKKFYIMSNFKEDLLANKEAFSMEKYPFLDFGTQTQAEEKTNINETQKQQAEQVAEKTETFVMADENTELTMPF